MAFRPLIGFMMDGAEPSPVPNDKKDEQTGRFERKYTDEAFLDAVDGLGPLAASSDIAERVGCNHITANERLRGLAEEGRVEGERRAGAVLWSLADGETDA